MPAHAATYSLVMINQQATYLNQMRQGAEREATQLGATLIVFNANDVPSAQNNAMDDYIQQKVDGIAVDAIDVNGLRSSVKAANAAGIPAVGIDAVLPPGSQKLQVGVDNAVGGKLIANYLLVVQQDRDAMRAAAIRTLDRVHAGQPVEANMAVPLALVTSANVAPYRAVFKK
jgi:ABC-type sugar transport system substrate-binding protein